MGGAGLWPQLRNLIQVKWKGTPDRRVPARGRRSDPGAAQRPGEQPRGGGAWGTGRRGGAFSSHPTPTPGRECQAGCSGAPPTGRPAPVPPGCPLPGAVITHPARPARPPRPLWETPPRPLPKKGPCGASPALGEEGLGEAPRSASALSSPPAPRAEMPKLLLGVRVAEARVSGGPLVGRRRGSGR